MTLRREGEAGFLMNLVCTQRVVCKRCLATRTFGDKASPVEADGTALGASEMSPGDCEGTSLGSREKSPGVSEGAALGT
jgi:hypothetical protein